MVPTGRVGVEGSWLDRAATETARAARRDKKSIRMPV
jgi:hypothetical protein